MAVLYDLYGRALYRIGYRLMGSAADAEDVVQDVFLSLPIALRSFEGRGSFEGWLRRIATRVALMKLRKTRTRSEISLDGWLGSMKTESRVVERITLNDAIQRLPQKLRVVFVLKEIEGYSHREIADLLGISLSASRVRLMRARMQLRGNLTGGSWSST